MDEALTALLLANATVSGLVGDGDRLFWNVLGQGKQGTAAVLYLVSGVPDYHMQGPSGLVESRVQIDCRASTLAAAKALSDAIEAVLSGYSGNQGGVKFNGIFKDSARSSFVKTEAEAFYLYSADYLIWSSSAT